MSWKGFKEICLGKRSIVWHFHSRPISHYTKTKVWGRPKYLGRHCSPKLKIGPTHFQQKEQSTKSFCPHHLGRQCRPILQLFHFFVGRWTPKFHFPLTLLLYPAKMKFSFPKGQKWIWSFAKSFSSHLHLSNTHSHTSSFSSHLPNQNHHIWIFANKTHLILISSSFSQPKPHQCAH